MLRPTAVLFSELRVFGSAVRTRGPDALQRLYNVTSRSIIVKIPTKAKPAVLTSAETKVCTLLKHGMTNEQIASRLAKSPATVQNQIKSIFAKIRVKNRGRAIAILWGSPLHADERRPARE
jgi:DNA-binding CsgD family transcriptional regulator